MPFRLLFALFTVALSPFAYGELNFAPTLSDGMVLQRNQPIVVWGSGLTTQAVTVNLGDETVSGVVDADGKWQVVFKAKAASNKPVSLVAASGAERVAIADILVGDVWFCAGQSNMALMLRRADNQDLASANPGNAQIRFLNLSRSPFTKPIVGDAAAALAPTAMNKKHFYKINGWYRCDTDNLNSLSAVAYWFAQSLQSELNVPVGLIVPPVGGSAAQAWVSRASIDADPQLQPILGRWIDDEPERLQLQLNPWLEANPGATFDQTPLHRHRPTTLFETAVSPMARHAIRGVIWYQGEQNAQDAIQAAWHEKSFPYIVRDFRQNWNQSYLPFYYVQLPAFDNELWPVFREQQRQFQQIPNTGMAVTIDLGEAKNIHPKNNLPVGQRLAKLALKHTYDYDLIASGPTPESASATEDGHVRLTFANVGDGLRSTAPEISGFEVAGADESFTPAVAKITSRNSVIIYSENIVDPEYIRYAWAGFPRLLTLTNSEQLPAGPFQVPVDMMDQL